MKKILFLCIFSAIFLFGCNDFLDLSPISVASVKNYYKNQTDIKTAVNAAYASLQSNDLYRSSYITMMEVRSDNVTDNNPGGSAGVNYDIDQFSATPTNTVIRRVWKTQYNQIYRLNNILANLDVVDDVSLRKQFEGEAKFLRGLAYFNLVRLWGPVPLVLKPITTDDAYSYKRNPVAEVYAAIEADLTDAQQLPKSYSGKELGRATSGAAKVLLAKVYLTEAQYSKAQVLLKDLLTNYAGVYTLLNNIANVYAFNNEMNSEIVFAIRFSKTIPDETNSTHDAYNKFIIDPNLLKAYQSSDERRDMLNLVKVNSTYVVKKYADLPDATTKGVGFDFPLLRYSDVYLMYAEVLNELGYSNDENGEAFRALNTIRNRAKAPVYKATELNNQASFRNAILNERRLEFPLENNRWFDLIRTNTAIQAMTQIGLSITKDDFLYPIPQTEIDIINNPVDFPQNPGY